MPIHILSAALQSLGTAEAPRFEIEITTMDLNSITITSFSVRDLRWPTSLDNIGTDPMNLAGENSRGISSTLPMWTA